VHCVRSGQIPETFVQADRSVRPSSPLLIRGFGVRVPGGAPAPAAQAHPYLTWPSGILPANHAAFDRPEQQRPSFAVPMDTSVIIVRYLAECPGHALSRLSRHFRSDMAVGVHGQYDLAVPETRRGLFR
jgi:hypothetical protein